MSGACVITSTLSPALSSPMRGSRPPRHRGSRRAHTVVFGATVPRRESPLARKTFRAEFRGRLAFDDPDTKGLLFDTPEGEAAVLWNRADGYILNADHDPTGWHFPAPEVWVDPWPTKTSLTVATTGRHVVQLDAIGRLTEIPVAHRSAAITLDGAPRVFFGLATTPGAADAANGAGASHRRSDWSARGACTRGRQTTMTYCPRGTDGPEP